MYVLTYNTLPRNSANARVKNSILTLGVSFDYSADFQHQLYHEPSNNLRLNGAATKVKWRTRTSTHSGQAGIRRLFFDTLRLGESRQGGLRTVSEVPWQLRKWPIAFYWDAAGSFRCLFDCSKRQQCTRVYTTFEFSGDH